MSGMKRIKKLIAAWLTTHEDPAVRIDHAHNVIKAAIDRDAITPRDLAIFDNVFADALDLAEAARKSAAKADEVQS